MVDGNAERNSSKLSTAAVVSGWAAIAAFVAPVTGWNQTGAAIWAIGPGLFALVRFYKFDDPRRGRGRAWFGVIVGTIFAFGSSLKAHDNARERGPSTPIDQVRPPPTVAPNVPPCDPNYQSACVPVGRGDVDCADVAAKGFRVSGIDIYALDQDGDGIACE